MKIFFISNQDIKNLNKHNTLYWIRNIIIFLIAMGLSFLMVYKYKIPLSQYSFMKWIPKCQRITLLILYTISFYEVFNFLNFIKSLGVYKIKIGRTYKYIHFLCFPFKVLSAYSLALGVLNQGMLQFYVLILIILILFSVVFYDLFKDINSYVIKIINNKNVSHKKHINKIKFIINNSNITKYDILQIFDNM